MSNPWKGRALRIARQASSGVDRLILQAAAEHIVSEEGFRVALAAVGREPEAGLVEHLREIEKSGKGEPATCAACGWAGRCVLPLGPLPGRRIPERDIPPRGTCPACGGLAEGCGP